MSRSHLLIHSLKASPSPRPTSTLGMAMTFIGVLFGARPVGPRR